MLLAVETAREGSSCCGARCSRVEPRVPSEHGTKRLLLTISAWRIWLAAFPETSLGGAPATECSIDHLALAADDLNI